MSHFEMAMIDACLDFAAMQDQLQDQLLIPN